MTDQSKSQEKSTLYQIQVQGRIGDRWTHWFDTLTISFEHGRDGAPVTTLAGPVVDQADLRGILNKLWDLNLTLISVTTAEMDSELQGGN
jgi:hypothetical protein